MKKINLKELKIILNNLNYVLIIFKDCAMLLQNKKTYLNKSYILLKDIRSNFDFVLMKNERSIMDHH